MIGGMDMTTMPESQPKRRNDTALAGVLGLAVASMILPDTAMADEGGVSFWLPGQYGSLAATPAQPGWSFAAFYYHVSVDAGGGKVFPRGGVLVAGLAARADLGAANATYVFANPIFDAQAAVSLTAIGGHNRASIDATVTGPLGNVISGNRTDTITGIGDLYPTASLKWNRGVDNFMVYLSGDLPVGAYRKDRLANLGIGHAAIDGGAGYTYFNPQTGYEFSVVSGLTYNFENTQNDYQNGIDWHVDWGASKFLTKDFHIGAVGYFYQQLTGDSGAGAVLGDFKSRVAGIGPQMGYLFPVGEMQGYLNLKGYWEFAAENRPEGFNVWATFALSPAAHAPTSPRPLITK
jgi:hypothetical protein